MTTKMPVDKGGFGPPKPLGKKKLSESAVLENEAREMEQRLRMLQTRMATQADEDAKVVKVGGSRWRGARTDKGSVTRYNHTVQERHGKIASSNDYQESMSTLRPSANAVAKKEVSFVLVLCVNAVFNSIESVSDLLPHPSSLILPLYSPPDT